MCADKGAKKVTANGLYRSSSKGYGVYGGGGGGGRLMPTKNAKKSQVIIEICTPPQSENMGFPRGLAAPYHTITQLLLLSDKIL
jgi:hypothetical protein